MRALLFTVLFLVSCGSVDVLSGLELPNAENVTFQDYEKKLKNGLSDWKNRHKQSHLKSFLRNFGVCAKSSEEYNSQILDRYKVYEMLSRGYYILGYYHEKNLEKSKKYWQIGASYAEKALLSNNDFKKAVAKYGEYVPALSKIKNYQVPSLYWYLANIGMWAKNSGVSTTLKYLKLIKSMIKRIERTDPNYYYSGLDRYRGAYFAVIPSYAGGSINKSRDFFLSSIQKSPSHLGTKVLYAKIYALKTRNKPLFRKLLVEVINTTNVRDPNIKPENLLEQREAKKLLKNINELF